MYIDGSADVSLIHSVWEWRCLLLYFTSFLNWFALSVAIVPQTQLICLVLGGTATTVTSKTAFVVTTTYFLSNLARFVFSKYNAALSDYVGRKPVMLLALFGFIVSRLLFVFSTNAGQFFFAAVISGTFDVFYAVACAYLSDVLPPHDRGRAFGIQTGASLGLGFTVGVPLGAVLVQEYSAYMPFYVSIASACLCALFVICLPIDDTLGAKVVNEQGDKKRSFPPSLCTFLLEHSFWTSLKVMREGAALSPYDWLTNLAMQSAMQILISLFLLFGESELGWSGAQAGIAFAFVGISIAVFSPCLMGRYTERPLILWGACVQILGYFFFSLSGTSISSSLKYVSYPGILCIAIGGVWSSAMQATITRQYNKDKQGEVLGVLAQQSVFAICFAYPISILFSFAIENTAKIRWPGCVWVFAAFYLSIGIFIQLFVFGSKASHLERKYALENVTSTKRKQETLVGEVNLKDNVGGEEVDAQVVSPIFAQGGGHVQV